MNLIIQTGTMLSETAFAHLPVLIRNAGLKFFIVDCEHGPFDLREVSALVMNARLVGVKCFVRIPCIERENIIKFMDMGANGLILPMTNGAADIARVVEYAKYPPVGRRGVSTTRAHTLYDPGRLCDVMAAANERTQVFAQIETQAGCDHLWEIVNVCGVDGVFIGPNDLSVDIGLADGPSNEIEMRIREIVRVANKAGKQAGIITTVERYIAAFVESGGQYISFGSELNAFKDYFKGIARRFAQDEKNDRMGKDA